MVVFQNCFYELGIKSLSASHKFIFIKHANKREAYRIFVPYNFATENEYAFRKDLGNLINQNMDGAAWQ